MSILNITCPICTEAFNNSDDVYSTSCGHIYHFLCMNDWRTRNTSCAQCRDYNPTYHKLYLSFDESSNTSEDIEMQQKLQSSNERITELQVQYSELELDFMKMQEQYTIAENARKALEENIKEITDCETNFMQLQGQYTESSELVKDLEYRIQQLHMANEGKSKQLQLLTSENESLKAAQDTYAKGFPDNILKQKLNILERKLEHVSKALENEINTNTQLSIEKMKLESLIKNSSNAISINNNKPNNSFKQSRKQNPKENQKPVPILNQNQADKTRNKRIMNPAKQNVTENRRANLNQNHAADTRNRCIIVKNIPYCMMDMPLKSIVVDLASKCNLSITADYLANVYFLDEEKTKLVAEFKTSFMKEKFLAKKILLKKDPIGEEIKIREFMDENILELYKYAKTNLKGKCFDCVFCANNKIFAKVYKEPRKVLQIVSIDQVDQLLKEKNANEIAESIEVSVNGASVD